MPDDVEDPSPDAAAFRCLVPFPDPTPSFVDGFEAGMMWSRLQRGEAVIEPEIAQHASNAEVYRRMAEALGYDLEIWGLSLDECMMVRFTKRPHRFKVV